MDACFGKLDGAGDEANCYSPDAGAQMERLVGDFGRMYRERNEALEEVARAHHDGLLRLAHSADHHDAAGLHIVRIGYLACALALHLQQAESFALLLLRAAPMHDIGMVGLPESVRREPGELSPEERELLAQHPRIGAQLLGRSRIPLFQLAAEVALAHHERWEGGGFPSGLAGTAIPLSGRIVAVVDAFDGATMQRPQGPAHSDDTALRLLQAERGRAYDPWVVDAFVDNAGTLIALRDRVNRDRLGFDDLSGLASPSLTAPA